MNKKELIEAVAEKAGMSRAQAELLGFGTFEKKVRPARQGRNPRTGETLEIAESKNVGFKAGSALRAKL